MSGLFLYLPVFYFILDPYKLIKVGANEAVNGDPLIPIQKELADIKYVKVPGLPSFTGNIYMYMNNFKTKVGFINFLNRWCCWLYWIRLLSIL